MGRAYLIEQLLKIGLLPLRQVWAWVWGQDRVVGVINCFSRKILEFSVCM